MYGEYKPTEAQAKRDEANGNTLRACNEAYSKGVEFYKEQVELRRSRKKYGQEFSFTLYTRLRDYINERKDSGKPMTRAGMILASGVTERPFQRLASGEFDYDLLAYMDFHDCSNVYDYDGMPCCDVDGKPLLLVPMSEIIERAVLMKEEEIETRMYETGRVGEIFALKSQHGWIEAEKAPQTVNNTLIIASETDARKAVELLK